MRSRRMNWLAFIFMVFIISACGGGGGSDGGGGADFMSVQIDAAAETNYVETASSAPMGYDPYVWSNYETTNDTIRLYSHADYDGGIYPTIIEIYINGNTTGTYQVSDGSIVSYAAPGNTTYVANSFVPITGGTITVQRFDAAAGGRVSGTYDVTAIIAGTVSSTVQLTGSFDVTRDD